MPISVNPGWEQSYSFTLVVINVCLHECEEKGDLSSHSCIYTLLVVSNYHLFKISPLRKDASPHFPKHWVVIIEH